MGFRCFHCGQCCENPSTQINATVGDVSRLCEFLGKPVEQLIPKYLSINPFGTPDSNEYELDLGLNIPCGFREDRRCTVYQARPLNCRFFPFWIVAGAELTDINSLIDKSNECHKSKFSFEDQQKCRAYVKALAKIFEPESELTDQLLEFLPARKVSLKDFPGYKNLESQAKKARDEREREGLRIHWLKERIGKHDGLLKSVKVGSKAVTSLSELRTLEDKTKPF